MLEKNPENRISLTNILTSKFIIKHYLDEGKHEIAAIAEENKSQASVSTNKNNEKSMEERKNRKKFWKKSLTHQNDSISYNDIEGHVEPNQMHNDLNPKFKKKVAEHQSAKSFNGNSNNLMPPMRESAYQKFSLNKMVGSGMNDSHFFDALENHEQLKSVSYFKLFFFNYKNFVFCS